LVGDTESNALPLGKETLVSGTHAVSEATSVYFPEFVLGYSCLGCDLHSLSSHVHTKV